MNNLARDLVKGIEQASRIAFKAGGETVLKQFSGPAGRALKNRNGEIMKVYNAVKRTLKKMK